jgi:NAD(P)-dependent dehydrogenase (short-subunit alcohol dehydrogenase family)
VRDVKKLHEIVEEIANKEGRLDGLIAAAGIQQETTALEYTAEDANRMFEVNITGVMMTAQAAAKQMIKFGKGGSIVLIASMSGHIANRVGLPNFNTFRVYLLTGITGPHLLGIQRVESRRNATRTEPGVGVGRAFNPRQYHQSGVYCYGNGGGALRKVSRAKRNLAYTEYAGASVEARGIPRCCGVFD